KDSSLEKAPLLEPDAIVLSKLLTTVCGKRLVQNLLGRLPVSLIAGRVHADGIDADTRREISLELLPVLRHPVADGSGECIYDIEQAYVSHNVCQLYTLNRHICEIKVIQREVGGNLTWQQFPADYGEKLIERKGFAD